MHFLPERPLSPVLSSPTITVIGDDESAGQALALDFQPISNLIMINRLPQRIEKSFQIDTDLTVSLANMIRLLELMYQLKTCRSHLKNWRCCKQCALNITKTVIRRPDLP